ncbi:MAG: hypothetical protein IT186_27190 [Acidobacteria bacterium]|nr:hypothetical protein [Acidobacteriota bacterium]
MKFPSFAALRGEPLKRRRARFGAQPAAARPARNRREQKNPPGPRAVSRRRGALNRSEDGLGSVVATNDATGAVTHSVVFDAWGNTKSELGTRMHPFTYTGREVGEAGLLFYRARFYQSGTGRFTQEDPLALRVKELYGYAANDPANHYDPTGLIVDAVFDLSTGLLIARDRDTGAAVVIEAESGGKPFGDPIPEGRWEILERAGKPDFFRLDAIDTNLRDDIHESTGRTNFRLHRPGRTIGCIAAKDWNGWPTFQKLLLATRTHTVDDHYEGSTWAKVFPQHNYIKRFGFLSVIRSTRPTKVPLQGRTTIPSKLPRTR